MNVPSHLNGYPVIQSEEHPNVATVLLKGSEKYIVATWWPSLGSAWMWGHYFHGEDAIVDALEDFKATATNNAGR